MLLETAKTTLLNPTEMYYGNGVTNQYQYDSLNRLTNLVWNYHNSSLGNFGYRLMNGGTRTNLSESINSGSAVTYQWSFDHLYRLTNENISAFGNVAYAYDPVGNRTNQLSTISGVSSESYTYDTNDEILTHNPFYNARGDMRGWGNYSWDLGSDGDYDYLGRLSSAANANGDTCSYWYDGDGNAVQRQVDGGNSILEVVDDENPTGYQQVLEQFTTSNLGFQSAILSRVYNYGLDLVSQQQFDSSTLLPSVLSYYGYDGHGSVRFLTDTAGNVTDTYAYDAYGNLLSSTGSTTNDYLYCDLQYDWVSGLYNNRARRMFVPLGIFTTRDGDYGNNEDPLSLHKYLYGEDDPIDGSDPSGNADDGGMGYGSFDIMLGTILTPVAKQISTESGTGVLTPLEAKPKDHDSRLLVATIFAESSTASYGGENFDEKEAIAVTIMNQAFYAVLPPGKKHNYNKSFGDGTILSAIQHGCASYDGRLWDLVASPNDLLPQSQLNSNLKLGYRTHFNLRVDVANLLLGYHAPLTIKLLNNRAPIGFHSGKLIGVIPDPDRDDIIGKIGRHQFYGFHKGNEYE
jgi:RHS repeat-associated protein